MPDTAPPTGGVEECTPTRSCRASADWVMEMAYVAGTVDTVITHFGKGSRCVHTQMNSWPRWKKKNRAFELTEENSTTHIKLPRRSVRWKPQCVHSARRSDSCSRVMEVKMISWLQRPDTSIRCISIRHSPKRWNFRNRWNACIWMVWEE